MWFSKGTSILIETLVQPQTNRVKEQKHCIFIKNGLSLCWVTGQLMSLLSSVFSKRCFPDQDRLLGVLTGQENIFFFFRESFSLFVLGLFKEMFSWPRKALRGVDGSRKYLFIFSKSFLFPSTVYSKRCFPDQERLLGVLTGQENIFLPSASLFSFRPQSIQRDVFLTKIGS